MRYFVFLTAIVVVLSTGQFGAGDRPSGGGDGIVFSDLDTGHWETDGPPTVDQPLGGTHPYAHHDHTHIHDHAHGHHEHADHHPHDHYIAVDGDLSGEVLHLCESDGIEGVEKACLCQQENGLYQQICNGGEPCDTSTGRCQQRSCFDACRFASPSQDDEGNDARNNCYTVTCGCGIPADDPPLTEEEKCQLDCADCGPFPVDWPMSTALKAAKHENVMGDIFGTGLEHASDYNTRSMRPLETLSNILF